MSMQYQYHLNYIARPGNAVKRRAHRLVKHAVETGVLVRLPCGCGSSEKTEAHHEDYSKPLEVMWLCRKCHAARHRGQRHLASPRIPKTHCRRGHALDAANLRLSADGKRRCRTCKRNARMARYQRIKKGDHQ